MATQNDKLDFEQPENTLSAIATAERGKLFPRNDYSPKSQKYSSVHPDANADGDELGRGTGVFLDIYNQNAGTSTDVFERKDEIKVNKYNPEQPYNVEG
jgi:hypothetical protein|tara:strand:+ start:143 stop:439 length:297 start_codon:yes stop_codon:yes gene_type:complete